MPSTAIDLLRLVAGPIALANGFGALAVADHSGEFTTYERSFPLAGALAVVVGLSLTAAGLATSFLRTTGNLAVLAGFLWFSPFWVGWEGGPPLVRSLGMVTQGLVFPILLHLTLSYPTGRLVSRTIRLVVAIGYIEAIVSTTGQALFRDPFFDPFCWSNCTDNTFLVQSHPPLARGIQHMDLVVTTAGAAGLASLLAWRLIRATRPARRALWPVLPGGLLLAAATIGHAWALAHTPLENPAAADFRATFAVGCAAVLLIAVLLPWSALRTRAQRRALSRIVTDLDDAPAAGTVRAALSDALGDPILDIAYWLPSTQSYVDASGRTLPTPTRSPGRSVSSLVRDGQTIAAVTHSTGVTELTEELGAAIRLALDNERLQAELLAQLEDLRTSRARIVETGDAHRRRLERDLHDGAQQDLLALLFDLRLARPRLTDSGAAETSSLFTDAERTVLAAVDELRQLANGIYPAALAQLGLGPTLVTLAEEARIPIDLDPIAEQRYPTPVETTAYVVIAEAIDTAARHGATYATVSVTREDHHLVIEVRDDGTGHSPPPTSLQDRVGALGGHLHTHPGKLRAEVPCG